MKAIIVGGGIVGLTTALTLHRAGIDARVYEQAPTIKELGVGLNLLPHSVKHLIGLGLQPQLDNEAVRTSELRFFCSKGKAIWQEPRGIDAGYDVPQYSVHRGRLLSILNQAVAMRVGPDSVQTNRRFTRFSQTADGVTAIFEDDRKNKFSTTADLLIGADGINSVVRYQLYPDQGAPHFSGLILWRGATLHKPFLTGRSMFMAGHNEQKVVVYPLTSPNEKGEQLVNWIAERRVPLDAVHLDDWANEGSMDEFAHHFTGWHFGDLDMQDLFVRAENIFKFPMIDRNPVDRWSFGRVTLAGDAAHAMNPNGSNGASQGILDAISLESHLAKNGDIVEALRQYEAQRLPPTSRLVLENRKTGPERVLQFVEDRCDGNCVDAHTCIPQDELEEVATAYKKLAGFDKASVNKN